MSELEEKINAILNNPGEMSKITQMARSLFGDKSEPERHTEKSETIGMDNMADMLDPRMISVIGKIMSGTGKQSTGQPLLEAMKPYLGEKRRSKMDKAMKIARMAKIAKIAFGEMGGEDIDI